MKTLIFLLSIIFSALAQQQKLPSQIENEAISSLIDESKKIIAQYAHANATGLISNATGQVGDRFYYCAKSYLNESLKGFPQQIIDKFNMISFSQSTEFESFTYTIKSNYTYVYELVGTAKANKTDVAVGLAYVTLYATTIEQYKTVKECHKCGLCHLRHCCSDVKQPVGFTSQQQENMVDFLLEFGYKNLVSEMEKLSALENYQMEEFHYMSSQDE